MNIRALEHGEVNICIEQILSEDREEKFGTDGRKRKHLAYALMDGDKMLGGVTGRLESQGFHIQGLGLEKEIRGKQYGTELMKKIEEAAIKEGAKQLTVSTQDYQALGFYEKLGYSVFGKLKDWPFEGTTKYYLWKKVEEAN